MDLEAVLPGAAMTEAFAKLAVCKKSTNAAYGAIMYDAGMVNPKSRCLKLPIFRQKVLNSGRFLSFKTTVKKYQLFC